MSLEQRKRLSEAKKGTVSPFKGKRSSKIHSLYCEACSKEFFKDPDSSNKLWERRRFCSKSCALKGNLRTLGKNKGESNGFWKGGITSKNAMIRTSRDYRLWREAVFERDNWTCVWCSQRGGKLNADHIKPFALFPELRLAIDNGRTLCVPCHKTTDTYAGRIFKRGNTSGD